MKKLLLLILLMPLATIAQDQSELTLESIFHEPFLPGVTPMFQGFSPDQSDVIVSWNEDGESDRSSYKVSISGGDLTKYEDDIYNRITISPDGNHFYYVKDNELWVSDRRERNKIKLLSFKDGISSITWSPDSKRLAYVQNGDVWITNIDSPTLTQVTQKKQSEPGYSINSWSGDGTYLVALQYDTSEHLDVYFPEYVDKFVSPGLSRRGQAKATISLLHTDSLSARILDEGVYYYNAITNSSSGKYLAVDRFDNAMKYRHITMYQLADSTESVVFADSTDGWLYPGVTRAAFSPENDLLMFTSEQSGFAHIYTINPDGTNLQQHTSGDWEIPWASWTDGSTIVFASTEVDPGERHIYTLNAQNSSVTKITETEGYRRNFVLSPNKRYLVYLKTYWNTPFELYSVDLNRPRRGETRVTNTIPERFTKIDWQLPEYYRIQGRDGETMLSMRVMKPDNFEEGEEYPVVVFAHGAGSLQNVYKGWSFNYWREFMFDQYLTQNGYVSVEVDFRHSTGYGRKFREDVTNWMGKYETEDIVDGLKYLEENYGYVDLDRVGIYGGSYGGFMALYAVSSEPDYFHAGAALRKVTNWENYFYANPWYTLPRLGHPDEFPEHYERSSPLSFADTLQHPVLLLHGLIDDNVGFQDAMQYVDKLIESGNTNFELMVYPSERHGFQSQHAWFDEYWRMFHFFEKNVKKRAD